MGDVIDNDLGFDQPLDRRTLLGKAAIAGGALAAGGLLTAAVRPPARPRSPARSRPGSASSERSPSRREFAKYVFKLMATSKRRVRADHRSDALRRSRPGGGEGRQEGHRRARRPSR